MDIAEGIKVSVKILACHGYLKSTTRGESQSKSEKDRWYHRESAKLFFSQQVDIETTADAALPL